MVFLVLKAKERILEELLGLLVRNEMVFVVLEMKWIVGGGSIVLLELELGCLLMFRESRRLRKSRCGDS
jgi:hypothetical protein